MVRSDRSQRWSCCGWTWPSDNSYCPKCGRSVVTADRVLLLMPIIGGGEIAVVANAAPDAKTWRTLVQMVEMTAALFEKREAAKPDQESEPTESADALSASRRRGSAE